MNGNNFFLALLGDRYGWTPTLDQEKDKQYLSQGAIRQGIEGSS